MQYLPLLLIVLFALPLFALRRERGDGIVLGNGAAFKVTAPVGWVFDNESCQPYFAAVIYPSGKSWDRDNAPVISNALYSKLGRTLDEIISGDVERTLVTCDGREARVRLGECKREAYIDAPGVYCQVTLSAHDKDSLDNAVPPFEEVVKSFRFCGPDSGEYLASSGVRCILQRTTEARDLFRFGRPEGWNQEPAKPGVTIFNRANGNAYGIIAIYPAKTGLGDSQADYETAWKEVAQSAFAVGSAPEPQLRTQEGCQVRIGLASVKEAERQSTLMLAVFSGWGKRTSILANFNDSSFLPEVENFLKTLHAYYTLSSVAGWQSSKRGSHAYVDGHPVKLSDDGYTSRRYDFGTNTYQFHGETKLDPDHYILLNESGTYSVNGNRLTLVGQGATERKLDRNGRAIASRSLPAWSRTHTFKMVDVDDAIHGPYLVLGGVEENTIDGAYDSFPNAFLYVRGYHAEFRFQQF